MTAFDLTAAVGGIPGALCAWGLFVLGTGLFGFVMGRRLRFLRAGRADPRFGDMGARLRALLVYGIFQKRQPRYPAAGIIHIMIFSGFLVLGLRSVDLITQGLGIPVLRPLLSAGFGAFYASLKDLFALIVIVACGWAVFRRAVVKPVRFQGSRQWEAYFVLFLIAFLMASDIVFEASGHLLAGPDSANYGWLPATTIGMAILENVKEGGLSATRHLSYWLHLAAFYLLLNFLPMGKHFHVITALPNVFLKKEKKGRIKPVRWDVADLEEIEKFGISRLEDFTWKHLLDLYTCTECGRCSDNCPAHAVGRPLSPKMITLRLRDEAYRQNPALPFIAPLPACGPVVGNVVTPAQIWSCTTCGACEEECPVFIEYIDKIVDMRRHLIESAGNPKGFNQVLMSMEKNGNPLGKPAVKRADWVTSLGDVPPIKILKPGDKVDLLYYVDSYPAYDPGLQFIARAVVQGLDAAGADFGILGGREKDSGHQVRRIGEEGLFQLLVEENMAALGGVSFNRIVTTDPHAFNTLKNDYPENLPVLHYAQFFWPLIENGTLVPSLPVSSRDVYTYHDPCYLGRHNGVYDAPRRILGAIPQLRLVEMKRCGDRSFCCGGGDVVLWHEIAEEETRMAVARLRMALDVGATAIVTACPFCYMHFEDAIKTEGFADRIRVVDLMQLLVESLGRRPRGGA